MMEFQEIVRLVLNHIVWWMTTKKSAKTIFFGEGVQTSPYSEFICGRAYIKDTDWSGKIAAGDQSNFSLYTIPHFHPKN